MNEKIEALVLSQRDYRENDDLLRVITRDHGLLTFIAHSARKLSSRNRYLPMCLYEFLYDAKDGKTMFTVHSGKLLESFYEDKDILRLSYLNTLFETLEKLGDLVNGDHYDALIFTLRNDNEEDRYLLGSLFYSFLCRDQGISPMVDGCAVCGKKQVVALSNRAGGFLCSEHAAGMEAEDVEALRKFRLVNKASFEYFKQLKGYKYDKKDFCRTADFFYENSGIHCRSYDFLMKL